MDIQNSAPLWISLIRIMDITYSNYGYSFRIMDINKRAQRMILQIWIMDINN